MTYLNGDDVIVALATPSGLGAIAVIRISGKKSISFIEACTRQKLSRQVNVCNFYRKDELIDEVVITTFKRGYTCEESAEISCHNSPYIIQNILLALIESGARMADHGEFTRRAFLNGRFDLLQAEAVVDLIPADSASSHKIALQQMKGNFSHNLQQIRQELIDITSLIELEIDFSQEDIEFVDREDISQKISEIVEEIKKLVASFELGDVMKNGLPIALVGKPNVGKSSLLNLLLNDDRAIVSNIPGTTRDTIEGEVLLGNLKCRFIDTAGLRENTDDEIEILGIKRSHEAIQKAKLVIYMTDVNAQESDFAEDLMLIKDKPHILVVNKIDLREKKFDGDWIYISTKEKKNVGEIEARIKDMFSDKDFSVVVANARHYDELKQILKHLSDAQKSLDDQMPNDIVMVDINSALTHLGYITGEVSNDDILDNIFKNFCIGK